MPAEDGRIHGGSLSSGRWMVWQRASVSIFDIPPLQLAHRGRWRLFDSCSLHEAAREIWRLQRWPTRVRPGPRGINGINSCNWRPWHTRRAPWEALEPSRFSLECRALGTLAPWLPGSLDLASRTFAHSGVVGVWLGPAGWLHPPASPRPAFLSPLSQASWGKRWSFHCRQTAFQRALLSLPWPAPLHDVHKRPSV